MLKEFRNQYICEKCKIKFTIFLFILSEIYFPTNFLLKIENTLPWICSEPQLLRHVHHSEPYREVCQSFRRQYLLNDPRIMACLHSNSNATQIGIRRL